MAELLTQGGFEEATGDWQFVVGGRSLGPAYEGSYSGWCRTSRVWSPFTGSWTEQIGSITQENRTFVAGVQYSYTFAVYLGPGWDATAQLQFNHGGGWYTIQTFNSGSGYGSWLAYSGTFFADGGTGGIRLVTSSPANNSNGNIYLDGCSIDGSDAVAITKNIKNNIVTDLDGLTVRSGVTIQEVGLEPKRRDEIESFPVLYILPGEGGQAELETISNLYGAARQTFTLQYLDKTETPNDHLDDATDAIRNALEASGSTVLAMNEVGNVVVESWSPVIGTDEETAMGVYYRTIDVVVEYTYTRGSA